MNVVSVGVDDSIDGIVADDGRDSDADVISKLSLFLAANRAAIGHPPNVCRLLDFRLLLRNPVSESTSDSSESSEDSAADVEDDDDDGDDEAEFCELLLLFLVDERIIEL